MTDELGRLSHAKKTSANNCEIPVLVIHDTVEPTGMRPCGCLPSVLI